MDIDMIEISKALSNETRLNILLWLKDPEGNFPQQGGCLSEKVEKDKETDSISEDSKNNVTKCTDPTWAATVMSMARDIPSGCLWSLASLFRQDIMILQLNLT